MKSFIIFALAAVLLSGVMCDDDDYDDRCLTDINCEHDECCVQSYPGSSYKVCRDMGDDVGDLCGGPHQCSSCAKGLTCVKDARRGFNTCQWQSRPYHRY